MLEAAVFASQSALAEELGCHRARVSRALNACASGLEWGRWRCAAVAEVLRTQTGGK